MRDTLPDKPGKRIKIIEIYITIAPDQYIFCLQRHANVIRESTKMPKRTPKGRTQKLQLIRNSGTILSETVHVALAQ